MSKNSINIQLPEILCICSCTLLISGLTWQAWLFFGLGLFGALIRTSLLLQTQKLAKEKVESSTGMLADIGKEIVNAVKNSGNDNRYH